MEYFKEKKTRTINVEVLLSSGTSQPTLDYNIANVQRFSTVGGNYYYIETNNEEYYFPIDRTIIKADKIK